jgi:HK97 family phage portal protein
MLSTLRRWLGFGAVTETYSINDPRIKAWFGNERAASGIRVNEKTALTCSAWYRGLDLLSSAIAKVPYGVYRNLPEEKGTVVDRSHEWHYALSKKPGRYLTAFQYRKLQTFYVAARGNAYAYVDRESRQLTPILPDSLTPVKDDRGELFYHYAETGAFYNPDEILHYKGMGFDGLVGYSVIEAATESLGLNMAARKFQATSLKHSARPSVILQFPRKLTDVQRKQIRDDWERMHAGSDNASRTAIVDGEMTIKDFAFSAEQIQLIETQGLTVKDISNFLGVPAHKIGSKEGQGYNSLEQENLAWTSDTLESYMVNIEQEDEDKLLTEDQKRAGSHEIMFDRVKSAFASADLSAKANYLRTGLGGGPWLTTAEARRLDGKNYIDGTDEIRQPANMGGQNNQPTDPASDPPKQAALQAATAEALEAGAKRVFKRLGAQARAAAKRGELAGFIASLKRDNIAAVSAELRPLEDAAGLAHGVDLAGKVAGQMLSHLEHRLDHEGVTAESVDRALAKIDAAFKITY